MVKMAYRQLLEDKKKVCCYLSYLIKINKNISEKREIESCNLEMLDDFGVVTIKGLQ